VGVGCRANSRVCLPWAIRSWLDRVPDLDAVERHDDGHYRGGVVHMRDVARHPARGAARHLGLRPELAAAAAIAHAAELADGWLYLRGSGGSEGARLRAGSLCVCEDGAATMVLLALVAVSWRRAVASGGELVEWCVASGGCASVPARRPGARSAKGTGAASRCPRHVSSAVAGHRQG